MRPQPEAEMQRQQRQIQHCFESGSVLATLKSWVKVRMLSRSFPEFFSLSYTYTRTPYFHNKTIFALLKIERFFIDTQYSIIFFCRVYRSSGQTFGSHPCIAKAKRKSYAFGLIKIFNGNLGNSIIK